MASVAKRVADHRAGLRSEGLRPVQIWVPDTRGADYDRRVADQLAALADSPIEAELTRELEAFLDWDDLD